MTILVSEVSGQTVVSDDIGAAIATALLPQVAAAQAAAALTVNATGVLNFDTLAELQADTALSYTSGVDKIVVSAGNYVFAAGIRYIVLASGASTQDYTTAGGVKVETAFAELVKSGSLGEPNNALNTSVQNKVASYATASVIGGATSGLPNFIGWKADVQFVTGTGASSYVFTVPFVVPNTAWSVRVSTIRLSDNVYTPLDSVTITGKGTTEITIDTGVVDSTYEIMAEFLGADEKSQADADSNPRLVIMPGGYNNLSNQLMTVIVGAHQRHYGLGNHNSILGGSNCKIFGGSYACIGGYNVQVGRSIAALTTTTGVVGFGQNVRLDGRGAVALGFNVKAYGNGASAIGEAVWVTGNSSFAGGYGHEVSGVGSFAGGYNQTISGNYSAAFGLDQVVTAQYSLAGGRANTVGGDYSLIFGWENTTTLGHSFARGNKGVVRNAFGSAVGFSPSTAGARQVAMAYAAVQTTDATMTTLTKTGGATITIGASAAARLRGTLIGRDKNSEAAVYFNIDALIRTTSGGTTTIVSGDPPTLTASDASLSTCTADLTAGSSGVSIKAQGVAATTINWLAVVEIVEVGAGAA